MSISLIPRIEPTDTREQIVERYAELSQRYMGMLNRIRQDAAIAVMQALIFIQIPLYTEDSILYKSDRAKQAGICIEAVTYADLLIKALEQI